MSPVRGSRPIPSEHVPEREEHPPPAPFATLVGNSRYVVLIAVVAVILVSITHFVMGAVMAAWGIWHSVQAMLGGEVTGNQAGGAQSLTVEFLEIVSVMLKAVVFYLIGTAFYSLFIAPLNLPAALGMETFAHLESKVVSVVIVIMAVTFLEHFVLWENSADTLMMGMAMALVVVALVAFQWLTHQAGQAERTRGSRPYRARRDLFIEGKESEDLDSEVEDALLQEASELVRTRNSRDQDVGPQNPVGSAKT